MTEERDMRAIELEGVENVRDLGGIPVSGGREVARGLLLRGAALAGMTEADRQLLFGDLGVRCVIDLRCGWERQAHPTPAHPGVDDLHIPFYDRDIVGIEYTEPAAGTRVVGRDVACDPDHFYRSLANPLTVGQMARCLDEVLARVTRGVPVYQHCSSGKDRTGIMALLVLAVLGAEPTAILDDYLLTNVSRDRNYQQAFERFLVFAQGDEERAHELTRAHRARPENLDAFHEAVCERYGSMTALLEGPLGVTAERRAQARAACTVEAPAR